MNTPHPEFAPNPSSLETRPKPDEAELARAKWEQYGGHLVQAIEVSHQPHGSSSKETDLFAIGDTMYARKIHIVPGESIAAPN